MTSVLRSLPPRRGSLIDDIIIYMNIKRHAMKLRGQHKHAKAKEIRAMMGNYIWEKYFTFAFIRNPWDTVVSTFHWWKEKSSKFQHFLERYNLVKDMTFDEFLRSDTGAFYVNEKLTDMFDFISDENDNIIVDFVGKYESLDKDFKTILGEIGVKSVALPWENQAAKREDYQKYYSDEARRLVEDRYSKIIKKFGYKF